MKDVHFYKDVIDGKKTVPLKIIDIGLDMETEDRVLNYAFEKFAEVASENDAKLLDEYLKGDVNVYSIKKFLAIRTIGEIGGGDYENKMKDFFYSGNKVLSSIALSSLCEMYSRNVLSRSMRVDFQQTMLSLIHNDKSASEDVIECYLALKRGEYEDFDEIFSNLKEKNPEAAYLVEKWS
ncbi:hypothetical protein [Hahella sp. NBU794]|uniref:hypothetical protein n=1 Tax=Hahella sp. NBU794 TaxID=3422590 RepID=UPI003D6F683E